MVPSFVLPYYFSFLFSFFAAFTGVCICYYTFWSGVADLSARHPRARSARGGGRINRNTATKGVIKCLLPLIGRCARGGRALPNKDMHVIPTSLVGSGPG